MALIEVRDLKKSFGERDILKGLSFDIRNGEKIGLVGWNGSGKTTLVKLLVGETVPDNGVITKNPQTLRIGYLPQSTDYQLNLQETAQDSRNKLFETTSQLGLQKVYNWDDTRLEQLSGGERLKLSLAGIWTENPELLILDEPTNHLDLKGVNWLIKELNETSNAAFIISHDRYFLDRTVTKIFELEDGKLVIYDGGYTAYREEKQRRLLQQQSDYSKQQRKIESIEQQVATLKQWSEKAHREAGKGGSGSENRQMGLKEYERVKAKKKDNQVKSKMNRLNLELSKNKVEKPKEELSIRFEFESGRSRGKRILEAKGLAKDFEDRILFEKSHFFVRHGERIALLGPNGSGKTTFIKMLLEEETISKGSLWKSSSLRIAYLSQDVNDLPPDKTPIHYLDLENKEELSRARTIFANMGMKAEKLVKPIGTLSLGERTRVKLVHMILKDYDMLILDEPTNHLDLPSREQMEETLSSYTGTLLIVSHDLYFVEKLCDKLLLIDERRIVRIEMGLKEYEERKKLNPLPEVKQLADERAILEIKINELLGKISLKTQGSEEYQQLDKELNHLIERKKNLRC